MPGSSLLNCVWDSPFSILSRFYQRYTNADLKILLYASIHIEIVP